MFNPMPYQGYQPTHNPGAAGPYGAPPPPQYAQFETSRSGKAGDDSLPAMPSWDQARERHVEEEIPLDDKTADPGMELGNLKKPPQVSTGDLSSGQQARPALSGLRSPSSISRPSPSPYPGSYPGSTVPRARTPGTIATNNSDHVGTIPGMDPGYTGPDFSHPPLQHQLSGFNSGTSGATTTPAPLYPQAGHDVPYSQPNYPAGTSAQNSSQGDYTGPNFFSPPSASSVMLPAHEAHDPVIQPAGTPYSQQFANPQSYPHSGAASASGSASATSPGDDGTRYTAYPPTNNTAHQSYGPPQSRQAAPPPPPPPSVLQPGPKF